MTKIDMEDIKDISVTDEGVDFIMRSGSSTRIELSGIEMKLLSERLTESKPWIKSKSNPPPGRDRPF